MAIVVLQERREGNVVWDPSGDEYTRTIWVE
jgi:hypothetical protein